MPETDLLGAELSSFIGEVANSVETIEVLALLVADTTAWLDAKYVADCLKTSQHSAAERLAHLAHVGLAASCGPLYRYAPSNDVRGALVLQLIRAYNSHRARVIQAVINRLPTAG